MHPSLRIIASGLAAGLLGACFDFDATMAGGSLDDAGLDAHTDASVTDGSLLGPDAPGDATHEAAGDAGSPEASPESSVADSGGPYCASRTRPDGGIFFCDDFDEHALPGSWQTWAQMMGTLVETDASAVSPPNSIDETTMPLTSGQVLNAALRTPLPVPAVPSTLTFAFSVEPVRIDATANASIVLGAVDFLDRAGYRYTVGLSIVVVSGAPALELGEQSGLASGGDYPDGAPPLYVNHPLSQTLTLPMNAWTDIVIELDWAAGSGADAGTTLAGKVTVGGAQPFDVPLTMTLVPQSLQIGIGTSFVTEYDSGPSPVWELRYDNVLFTAN
jgi:hypothetical protein